MNPQLQNTRGLLWIGLLPTAMGAMVALFATDILPTDDASYHAPRYIALLIGLMFFSVGVFVSLADSRFAVFHHTWWYKLILALAGLTFPAIFVFVFNWVSFGPGEREFSSSVSIPFLSFSFERASELFGRIVFAIPTLLMDAVVLYVVGRAVYQAVKNWVNAGE